MNAFRIVSIAAAVTIVAGLMMNWSDIKRYIKIERM